jgi:hypothetical protein
LRRLVEGLGERRAAVLAAAASTLHRLDGELPVRTETEGEGLTHARAACEGARALVGALRDPATDQELRAVVKALQAAEKAVAAAVRVSARPEPDGAVAQAFLVETKAQRSRLGDLRARILQGRQGAPPTTNYGAVTKALAAAIEAVSSLESGGVDDAFLVHTRTKLNELDAAVGALLTWIAEEQQRLREARAEALLHGPVARLGYYGKLLHGPAIAAT